MVQTPTFSAQEPAVENNPPGPRRLPELLAPAGDWECAKAAVENGADAIYFGLEKFNARMRAHNFTEAALPKLMEFLHRRGVKGYVTFNTLVFANELGDAENYLRAIIAAGVDAAIVQDVGICRLIRRLSPDFPIHASTQMTVTSAAGVEFARNLGCNLVVLARECSIKEIEKIQAAPSTRFGVPPSGGLSAEPPEGGTPNALPLEVFVHGALCVAYSGQCLTSESLGGRSANRGECAQACRMPYELISDGQPVPLGDKRYLLSPQDLAGLEVLPDLIRAGVSSLKIEGRLKSPEYVANITRVYRKALDDLRFTNDDLRAADPSARQSEIRNRKYDMEMAFSRGLYTGWFRGINNQELAHARFGKKRGVFLGEVSRIQGGRVALKLAAPLKPGDGVVFDAGRPDQDEEGGRVYTLEPRGGETFVGFGHGDLDFNRIHVGDKIWKTSDPELDRRLRQSFAGDAPHFTRPVDFEVHGCVGQPMTVIARDETGHVAQVASAMPLAPAEKQPLTMEKLRAQLGRLGGTPLHLGALNNSLAGEVMLPVSELNRLRREVVVQLEILRAQPKRWTLNECGTRSAECGVKAISRGILG
jgi:putative protease